MNFVQLLLKKNNTENISSLNGILHNPIDLFAPLRKFHQNPNKICPWIINNIKNLISKRDKARKQAVKSPHCEKLKLKFKALRNQVSNIIRNTKGKYYTQRIEDSFNNPKMF